MQHVISNDRVRLLQTIYLHSSTNTNTCHPPLDPGLALLAMLHFRSSPHPHKVRPHFILRAHRTQRRPQCAACTTR